MKHIVTVLCLLMSAQLTKASAQMTPQIEGDSVRYDGRKYSFAWNSGYDRGVVDGERNQYNVQSTDAISYFMASAPGNSTRTEVSEDWVNGYKMGHAVGLARYNQQQAARQSNNQYTGNRASSDWYENNMEYQTAMMPGVSYNFLLPVAKDSLGRFQGIGIEYLFYAKVTQNDDPGPSHVRFYGRVNLLKNTRKDVLGDALAYSLGIDLSLEKNPKRSIMVPYFGLETGGISQKQLGTNLQFTPTFGVHILSKKNLFVSVQGGYMYPLRNFEVLRGYTAQGSLNFALW